MRLNISVGTVLLGSASNIMETIDLIYHSECVWSNDYGIWLLNAITVSICAFVEAAIVSWTLRLPNPSVNETWQTDRR